MDPTLNSFTPPLSARQTLVILPFGASIDGDVARYGRGLRTWMRASYEFSRTAVRYRSA